MKHIRKVIIFVILSVTLFIFLADKNYVYAAQARCNNQVGDRSDSQAADDTNCAAALNCPEELRQKGKCGSENQLDEDSLLGNLCKTFSILCSWGEAAEDFQGAKVPLEKIKLTKDKINTGGETAGTRVISQDNLISGVFDRLKLRYFTSDNQTGALNSYLSYSIQKDSGSGTDPLVAHNSVAGCGEGGGGAAVPYILCDEYQQSPNQYIDPEQGVNFEIPEVDTSIPLPSADGLVYFSQQDPEFGGVELGDSGCDIKDAGCGPTTVAMACASFTDKGESCHPTRIIEDYYSTSDADCVDKFGDVPGGWCRAACFGSYGSRAKWILEDLGFETTNYITKPYLTQDEFIEQVKEYLDEGWQLFVGADFLWDKWYGHFLWVTDIQNIDGQNVIFAMDPYYGFEKPVPLPLNGYTIRFKDTFGFKPSTKIE